ncbi:MAG: YdcF family protein [Hyphomicrobiaceae bacterium]|nr:YdcF family protein [Hyphomicrobiaceae bacterium]
MTRRVARRVAWAGAATAAALLAFAAGFVLFARTVAGYVPDDPQRADAIVVLTGGELRLAAGAKLLKEGLGARLLISGVNPRTSPEDLRRASGLPVRLFSTRVDIDYAAHTTTGNANETKAWAKSNGYAKLIVVTSAYHMPRSLMELRRTMPDIMLVPHPVVSNKVHAARWWMDPYTARVLLAEYLKFLPSAARYGVARLLGWQESALAAKSHAAPG